MPICRMIFLAVCVLGVTTAQPAGGGQAGRGAAAAETASLPYKLVEWPAPPISAAGVCSRPSMMSSGTLI